MKIFIFLALVGFFSSLMTGCGIKLGGACPNDSDPAISGAVSIAQGAFTSVNGRTVTGNAIIYSGGTQSYVLRLSGITTPSESGLQIRIVSSASLPPTSLRAFCGNQNYNFSLSGTPTFSQVNIYSPTKQIDYGEALLQ